MDELLQSPNDRSEQADCLLLLLDIARKSGTDANTLLACAWEKFEINQRRKWKQPDADGVCEHQA